MVLLNMLTSKSVQFYNKHGLNFVTFSNVFTQDFCEVIKIIQTIITKNNLTKFEIKVVDDGSSLKDSLLIASFCKNSDFKIVLIRNSESMGVSAALNLACVSSYSEFTIAIPGHNMFDEFNITKVIDSISNNSAVLGYRVNLFYARPILKYLGSKILTFSFNLLHSSRLKDINGLNLYLTNDILKFSKSEAGHGNHILIIKNLLKSGKKFIQVPIKINPNHKKRKSRQLIDNFPKPHNIFEVVRSLLSRAD